MIDNKLAERSVTLPNYFIKHELFETSRMMDYDNDPTREWRRFYGSLLHKLSFIDQIIGNSIIEIEFMSDTADKIYFYLMNVINHRNEMIGKQEFINDSYIRTEGIPSNSNTIIGMIELPSLDVQFDIVSNSTITTIVINESFIEQFAWVSNVEEDFSFE